MNENKLFGRAVLMFLAATLAACASKEPGFYRHSPVVKALEVPPDLTAPEFQETFEVPQIGQLLSKEPLLSDGSRVRLHRDGQLRWLEIDAEPHVVWEHVKDFWIDRKIPLEWQNQKLGIMETEWLDNYASDYARDRFRVRVEAAPKAGTTWLFVSHRGVQRELDGGDLRPVWTDRLGDPELEVEILGLMLDFFSLEPRRKQELIEQMQRSKPESTLKLDDPAPAVEIHTEYNRSWQLVALAVDRMGHIIESRNRDAGKLVVRINEEETGIGALFGSREKISVKLTELSEKNVRVNVENEDGTVDASQEAKNFLIRLKEHL